MTERIASALGGTLLTAIGLRKKDPIGIALAVAGGYLISRGATGYCPVNQAIDRNTANENIISVEITRSLTINRPRNKVYMYWHQLENLPKFMEHLEDVRQLGPAVALVGTHTRRRGPH